MFSVSTEVYSHLLQVVLQGPTGAHGAEHDLATTGAAQGVAHGVAHGLAHGVAQGVAHGLAHGVTHGLAHGAATGAAHGVGHGAGHGLAQGVGQGAAQGVGQGAAQGVGHGAAQGVTGHALAAHGAGTTVTGTAQGVGHGVAQGDIGTHGAHGLVQGMHGIGQHSSLQYFHHAPTQVFGQHWLQLHPEKNSNNEPSATAANRTLDNFFIRILGVRVYRVCENLDQLKPSNLVHS